MEFPFNSAVIQDPDAEVALREGLEMVTLRQALGLKGAREGIKPDSEEHYQFKLLESKYCLFLGVWHLVHGPCKLLENLEVLKQLSRAYLAALEAQKHPAYKEKATGVAQTIAQSLAGFGVNIHGTFLYPTQCVCEEGEVAADCHVHQPKPVHVMLDGSTVQCDCVLEPSY